MKKTRVVGTADAIPGPPPLIGVLQGQSRGIAILQPSSRPITKDINTRFIGNHCLQIILEKIFER